MNDDRAVVKYEAAKPVQSRGTLQGLLEQQKDSIAAVLPQHIRPEHIIKMALLATTKQPKLLQCTQESVLKSVMDAASLGLDCSGTLGSSWIVPYGKSAQLIIGYRGLIDLARRSGQISRIEAHLVYGQDKFEIQFGLNPTLNHIPYMEADRKTDKSSIRCVYAVGELKDGSQQLEVMTLAEIEDIRNRSKAGGNGPWVTDFGEMARKTVVRRLCKYLPLSAELVEAINLSDQAEGFGNGVVELALAPTERASFDAPPELDIQDFQPDAVNGGEEEEATAPF